MAIPAKLALSKLELSKQSNTSGKAVSGVLEAKTERMFNPERLTAAPAIKYIAFENDISPTPSVDSNQHAKAKINIASAEGLANRIIA